LNLIAGIDKLKDSSKTEKLMEEILRVPVVAGVVLQKDGKYLLVQEAQPKAYGKWNWPAGRVEVGHTIEQTAIKEAKEEIGFEVELVRKLGVWQDEATSPPKHAFQAKIIGGGLKFPKDELLNAHWFTKEEIEEMQDDLKRY
jgi:ADP-ribose pyrophosphatase YjhB (NUDIX family)